MAQNLADLVSSVNQAQSHLRDTTPKTLEWIDAQRAAVYARADFWQAMGLEWDLNHPMVAAAAGSCGDHSA